MLNLSIGAGQKSGQFEHPAIELCALVERAVVGQPAGFADLRDIGFHARG